jgi:hypothetical protein
MKIGIIAEGPGDVAVLVNILRGKLEIDSTDIVPIRPELGADETDLYARREETFSNWLLVKRECVERAKIEAFLAAFEGERLVVIHIDTAEAELPGYDVEKPRQRDGAYADEVRRRVVLAVNRWLGGQHVERVRHAVAVEETDAWVLTLHATKDTATHPDPKKELRRALNKPNALRDKDRKRLFQLEQRDAFAFYDELSRLFRKARDLERCAERNRSLRLFVDSL